MPPALDPSQPAAASTVRRRLVLAAGAWLAASALTSREARAAALPASLRLIVPSPPGGAPDLVARAWAEALGAVAQRQVTVLNVDGANGELALNQLAAAPPDGGTWLLAQDSVIVINPSFYPRTHDDPLHGLAPVASVATNAFYLLVQRDDPIATFDDFLREARDDAPSPLLYGSGGVGSQHHLLMEELALRRRLALTHVPYRGNAPAARALVAGEIRVLMAGASALPLVQGGRLRVIAVTSPRRSPLFPAVPAVAEYVSGFIGVAWFGLFGRAGMPPAVLAEMAAATQAAAGSDGYRQVLKERGNVDADFVGGAAFVARIAADRQRFAEMASRVLATRERR
jgi:tripartite-type tricarboxylate transporter receptor subunit TctC